MAKQVINIFKSNYQYLQHQLTSLETKLPPVQGLKHIGLFLNDIIMGKIYQLFHPY